MASEEVSHTGYTKGKIEVLVVVSKVVLLELGPVLGELCVVKRIVRAVIQDICDGVSIKNLATKET